MSYLNLSMIMTGNTLSSRRLVGKWTILHVFCKHRNPGVPVVYECYFDTNDVQFL